MKECTRDNAVADTSAVKRNDLLRLVSWKKIYQWLVDYKWPLIGLMWVVTIALGWIGFAKYFSATDPTKSFSDVFYHTFQLFVLEYGSVSGPTGWELQAARLLAPALTVITAAQALLVILREQVQHLRIRFWRDHTVICGLGRKGLILSKEFCERGDQVAVIERDEANSMLERCREHGAITLAGNATDPGLLLKARVHKAKYVISVCGDDGANAEVAVLTRELVRNRRGKALSCLVHIVDLQLCNLLREREFAMGRLDAFRLEFFNVYESGARVLLNEYPPFSTTDEQHDSRPHMVVVGAGRMGESLVANAARNWREIYRAGGQRMRVTLVDREAETKKASLCLRHPQLEAVCELITAQFDIQSPDFERADFLFDRQNNCDVTAIYVCLDDDSRALAAALKLYRRLRPLEIPIVVRTTHDAGLATLLQGEKYRADSFTNIHAFGLLDRTCTEDLIHGCIYEILARAMHEDYVRNEKENGHTAEMNPSIVPWEKLPESLKESNRNQAEHIRVKLDAIGCDIAITTSWDEQPFQFTPVEVELLSRMEHDRFVDERLRAGWTYGDTKDTERKTNPTLVPWDQLSEEERDKDRNAVRGLPAFLAKAGFHIYRLPKNSDKATETQNDE